MPQILRSILRAGLNRVLTIAILASLAVAHPVALRAQTAGEGTITGTVTDGTGAVIPDATVTATNTATNVSTSRTSSSAGLYSIAPLEPGHYTVTVEAKGFKTLKQQNLDVVGLGQLGFNPTLTVGGASEEVVVSAAPPVLDTESPLLGVVMETEVYSSLPLLQSTTQQRDPTAFATLVPGSQGGARTPVIGGTSNYSGFLYVDGIPAETINQQGDNRTVSLNFSPEAIEQFQVNTSVPPAEYMGAGSLNFTMKSGTLKYHGQVSGFIRNTVFEAWSFTQKASTVKNSLGQSVQAPKNNEHPDEISASIGGYVPHTAHKVFFFFAYDRYHSRFTQNPSLTTIPTTLMENGDFTEFGTATPFLFDPTTNACNAAGCTRQPFAGLKNGNPTFNVIPAGAISPITAKMESYMPNYNNPTAANYNNSTTTNNYLSTGVGGRDNHLYDYRVDIDLSQKNRISTVGALGHVVYANNFSAPYLPAPYTIGDYAIIVPKVFDVQDAYIITPHMTNQFKFGYTRFYMPIISAYDTSQGYGDTSKTIGAYGVTNLPGGQSSTEFPNVTFGNSTAVNDGLSLWGPNGNQHSTQLTIPNNYALVDNLQWLKGKHQFTFGFTFQFEGLNNANPASLTGILTLPFNQSPTASYVQGATGCAATAQGCSTSIDSSKTGSGYASFLLGAVDPVTLPIQYVATVYSRIKPFAPYVEDSFRLTQKLVVDLGLRWDYLPPLHYRNNQYSFLNPTQTNPATGYAGDLEFAGNYGGSAVSCGCTTPLNTYWKNFGPRLGVNYSVNDKTVFRAAAAIVYSQGGGTGGGRVSGNGGSNGAAQTLGFNVNAVSPNDTLTGVNAGPSFWLNSNGAYLGSRANTALFGGAAYPTAPAPGVATQILDSGNYLNSSNQFVTASNMGYMDPYEGGRAPMYTFWNAGFERTITRDMTLEVNYAGDESHHAFDGNSGNSRGYWVNQINPAYLATLGSVAGYNSAGKANAQPLLLAPATSANVAILDGVIPSAPNPASFIAAANAFPSQSGITIGQMLAAFPQYSSLNDGLTGSYVDNFSYNALQITLRQRTAHGLTFNVNYTYSKNIGDDGTFRSGYDIPAAAVDGHAQSWRKNRIDRSWTSVSLPQLVNAYGTYVLPIGTPGHIGGGSWLSRELVGGWRISGIYTYTSGSPIVVTWGQVGNCANALPNAGQCQASVNPAFSGSARINGSYGSGPHGFTACNLGIGPNCSAISYINNTAFQQPADISSVAGTHQYLIGNAPRSQPLNLRNPGSENLNASIQRTFPISERVHFIFQADCTNVWNKTTFNGPNGSWGSGAATFGQITGASGNPRDWQFSGHLNF